MGRKRERWMKRARRKERERETKREREREISLDAYKGKSRHVLEFVKRALTVEMRGLLFRKRKDG